MSGALPLRFGLGHNCAMAPVIPFRRRSSLPSFLIVLGASALAVFAFAATTIFMNWQSEPVQQTHVQVLRPNPTHTKSQQL